MRHLVTAWDILSHASLMRGIRLRQNHALPSPIPDRKRTAPVIRTTVARCCPVPDLCTAAGTASNRCRAQQPVPDACRSRATAPCASRKSGWPVAPSTNGEQSQWTCAPSPAPPAPPGSSIPCRYRRSKSLRPESGTSECASARAKLINCFCPVEYSPPRSRTLCA